MVTDLIAIDEKVMDLKAMCHVRYQGRACKHVGVEGEFGDIAEDGSGAFPGHEWTVA